MITDIPREVLVVEAEPLVRMVTADALAERGIMAWEARDAAEALDVLDEHPAIGLVLTDVRMPGEMDGLDLAHALRRRRPDLGVVVTSGATEVAESALPDDGLFLRKPFPAAQLVSILEQRLDQPA